MRIILTIILALFLPLAALMVVFSTPVCQALAEAAIPQNAADPAEHEELVSTALAVRDFSLGNDNAAMPTGSDYHTAITPDAVSHLLSVRTVFLTCVFACILLFVALLVLIIIAVKRKGSGVLARPLIIGGAIPLAAAIVLGVVVMVDFEGFFVWMHGLFFAAGTWTFPDDSLLIRSLPYNFWVSCGVVWAASMAVLCLISVIIGIVFARRSRRKRFLAHLDNSLSK